MSEFTSQGFEHFPSLYADTARLRAISELSTERIEEMVTEYGQFLSTPRMPRATETSQRILDHALFELAYRDGVYDEQVNEDELCGSE